VTSPGSLIGGLKRHVRPRVTPSGSSTSSDILQGAATSIRVIDGPTPLPSTLGAKFKALSERDINMKATHSAAKEASNYEKALTLLTYSRPAGG